MKWALAAVLVPALVCGAAASARAQLQPSVQPLEGSGDGVYGRFDGDLDLGLALGARIDGSAQLAGRGTAHYFSMAGVYVSYARALDRSTALQRVVSLGVDVRPSFVPRWTLGLQRGPTWLDLTVDALSLSLGTYWAESPAPDSSEQRGLEAGLGVGVPLLGAAAGPWLELDAQWLLPDSPNSQRSAAVFFGLAWHALWASPLARGAP